MSFQVLRLNSSIPATCTNDKRKSVENDKNTGPRTPVACSTSRLIKGLRLTLQIASLSTMPVTRTSLRVGGSRSRTPRAELACPRRRQSPPHTALGPLLNGDITPDDENRYIILTSSLQRDGTTLGLYFGHDQALPERKSFDSVISLLGHKRFIDARSGFEFNTDADDLYKAKITVGTRKYYVIGTYNQASCDTNTSFSSYGCTQIFKGDLVIFFYSVHGPERFLDYIPRYPSIQDREDAIRRVLTA
ncbi:hypothetical protein EV361DRAFT_871012 [Lentinula raphanica]|nr:hypothetical protein EV361DRAFT_871012 [Lentinula raphanica]